MRCIAGYGGVGEVADITAVSQATVINIGTLNSRTIESMIKAGITATRIHQIPLYSIPSVPAHLITQTVYRLLDKIKFTVMQGDMSENKNDCTGT